MKSPWSERGCVIFGCFEAEGVCNDMLSLCRYCSGANSETEERMGVGGTTKSLHASHKKRFAHELLTQLWSEPNAQRTGRDTGNKRSSAPVSFIRSVSASCQQVSPAR